MRLRRPFALALVLAFPLVACGGDDGGGGGSASGSGPAGASGSASGPETTGDTTGATGGGAEASATFCEQAEALAADDSFDDLDIEDPEAVQVAIGVIGDWADEAPDDVAADLRTLVTAFEEMITLFADPSVTQDPEAMERLEEVGAETEAAETRVEDFVQDACGVDLSGDGS